MIFKISKLIVSEEKLLSSLNQRLFVTYANVNSFRVGGNFRSEFNFYSDGRPVAFLFSLLIRKRVKRLTALSIDNFWVRVLKDYRVVVVGYEESVLDILKYKNLASGIAIDQVINGYYSLAVLKSMIENILLVDKGPTIIFLALGQPKQEQLLSMLSSLNGKVSVVCVGAYFKQRCKLVNEFHPVLDRFGLTPVLRFWKKPLTLLERTLISLMFIPFRIEK